MNKSLFETMHRRLICISSVFGILREALEPDKLVQLPGVALDYQKDFNCHVLANESYALWINVTYPTAPPNHEYTRESPETCCGPHATLTWQRDDDIVSLWIAFDADTDVWVAGNDWCVPPETDVPKDVLDMSERFGVACGETCILDKQAGPGRLVTLRLLAEEAFTR